MKNISWIVILFLAVLPLFSFAQEVEMADTFRSDGKIYVVIAVIGIILVGLIAYLFMLGRKISKIEQKVNESK